MIPSDTSNLRTSRSTWKIHICTMTEDQSFEHPSTQETTSYESAVRRWLLEQGHTILTTSNATLLSRLKAAQDCDVCLVVVGFTFGLCDRRSSFSDAELEVSAAADIHHAKILLFVPQAIINDKTTHTLSPEQSEFIQRLRNFSQGWIHAKAFNDINELRGEIEKALEGWHPPVREEPTPPKDPPPSAVMISSTGDDEMLPFRGKVDSALRNQGIYPINYIYEPSEAVTPLERVISWARGCSMLVLIMGTRYGYVSPIDGLGITELEFTTALQAKRPILAFIGPGARKNSEEDQRLFVERVDQLLPREQIFDFADEADLERQVSSELSRLKQDYSSLFSEIPTISSDWANKWYRHLLRRWLGTLPHLTQPKGMSLEDVFVSLQLLPQEQQPRFDTQVENHTSAEHQGLQHKKHENLKPIEADEALRRYSRMVVRGDPGTGKSVILRWYALSTLQTSPDTLPILIRLGNYARDLKEKRASRLLDAIGTLEQHLFFTSRTGNARWTEAVLGGKGLVLLDAFDEVPLDQQNEVAEDIQELASLVRPSTRIIVTTRITAFRPLSDFTVADIQPLNLLQQRELARQWLRVAPADGSDGISSSPEERNGLGVASVKAERLMAFLGKEPRLAEWASNPLLLTFLAALSETQVARLQGLPTTKPELYRRVLRLILGRWRMLSKPGERRPFQHLWLKEQMLVELARSGFLEQRTLEIRQNDAEQAFIKISLGVNHAATGTDVIHELNEQDGLLIRLGEGLYTFFHPTFQEYLVASFIATLRDEEEREKFVLRGRLSARWDEVSQLLVGELDRLGLHEEADKIVSILMQADEQPLPHHTWSDPAHLALARAARCQGARAKEYAIKELGSDLARAWNDLFRLEQSAPDFSLYVKRAAAQALAALGPAAASAENDLRIALQSRNDTQVSVAAIKALSQLESPEVVLQELRKKLKQSLNQEVVRATAEVLRFLGPVATPLLEDLRQVAFRHNLFDDAEVSEVAKESLFTLLLATTPTTEDLLEIFEDAKSDLRRAIVAVLGILGPETMSLVQRALVVDNAEVRLAALRVLMKWGPLNAPDPRSMFYFIVKEPDDSVYRFAVEVFLAMGPEYVANSGLEWGWSYQEARDADPSLDQESLIRSTLNKERKIRLDEKQKFGLVTDLSPLSAVRAECDALLNHNYPEERRSDAAIQIRLLGSEAVSAIDDLQTGLQDPSKEVRLEVLKTLGHLGPAAAPVLADLRLNLQSRDADIRQRAVQAIGCLGPAAAPALDDLRRALRDSNWRVRNAAAEAIGQLGSEATPALDDLRELLRKRKTRSDDYGKGVQYMLCVAAIKALGQLGTIATPALSDLQTALHDPNVVVRKAAAKTLGQLGREATPALDGLYTTFLDKGKRISPRVRSDNLQWGLVDTAITAIADVLKTIDDTESIVI